MYPHTGCNTCHKNKKQNLKYGNLPAKEAQAIPWDRLLVDLIIPYKSIREGYNYPLILKALTIIYPATEWFEIVQHNEKHADTIGDLVEKTFLCIYTRPTIIKYDWGNKSLGHAFKNDLIEK